MNLYESIKGNLKEAENDDATIQSFINKYRPLYDTKPVMKDGTLYADNINFRGSGISKRVEAILRPDNTMEVDNEEWGFEFDGSTIDENSMDNMSQYWFYNNYRSNEEFKNKIDGAAKNLYKDMVKLYDAMSKTTVVESQSRKNNVKKLNESVSVKDCGTNVDIIMALEGDNLVIEDYDDWEEVKNAVGTLSLSQGFYSRLLSDMQEYEDSVGKENMEFPMTM